MTILHHSPGLLKYSVVSRSSGRNLGPKGSTSYETLPYKVLVDLFSWTSGLRRIFEGRMAEVTRGDEEGDSLIDHPSNI